MSEVDPVLVDLRNFIFTLWDFLGLPHPTPAQYEIAAFLQHGFPATYNPEQGRFDVVEAFRGVGKSYLAAGYALWRLKKNPRDEKILVVSATSNKSKEFVAQCKLILNGWSYLAELRPRSDQRDAFDRFDVDGASISQSPSLRAAGITGQVTGSRATLIIGDDCEIPENSRTEESRKRILDNISEFDKIGVPAVTVDGAMLAPAADILLLGTPQTEESVYNRLIKEQGANCFCWPARYPTADKRTNYILKRQDSTTVDILAPKLRDEIDGNPRLAGKPTDPQRFDEDYLISREAKGRSKFMLQYQLDSSLSDAERYPLKQNDLIVMSCNHQKAPLTLSWGRDTNRLNVRDDIPNVGFSGDYFLGPLFMDKEWRDYQQSVLFVDPAGRGKDETAWSIVKGLNGMMHVTKVAGYNGPVAEAYLRIAMDAKLHNVNVIEIEPNFAPGIWIAGFQPVLAKVWPGTKLRRDGTVVLDKNEVGGCTVRESEWAVGQKEARIIDTLEPVLTAHRMVVDESVAQDEVLMYQLTHITRERKCLTSDDRLDSLAGAVASLYKLMAMDVDSARKEVMEGELDAELEDFVETCLGWPGQFRTGRARRRNRGDDRNLVYQSEHQ